jgi:hypothetical protein
MSTFRELGEQYAARIERAVARDQTYQTKGLIKQASNLASSNLGTEIIAIGRLIDGLTYEDDTPLSEQHKDEIVEEIAKELGWPQPRTLRRLTKGGSVDALLAMTQQLQALFTAVKK